MSNGRPTVYRFQMSIVVTLDIDIVEADGLPRPPSGHQRPSCVLTVAGRDAVQTLAPKKSDAPVWKSHFHFADLELDELVVRFGLVVVDRSREIGRVDVEQPLDGSAGQRIDAWADLSDGGRVNFVVSVVEIEVPPPEEPELEPEPEPPAEAPEEEAPQEEIEEPQQEVETADESAETEEAVTPRTRQLRTKLQNDKQHPHEIEQKARAAATRKYREFLKKRTPALLENAAIARQFREEAEQEEAARTPE
jgi:hypothetical protein